MKASTLVPRIIGGIRDYSPIERVSDVLFCARPKRAETNGSSTLIRAALISLIYLAGVLHWVAFFKSSERITDLGYRMSFNGAEWPAIFQQFSIIKEALTDPTIPYHASRSVNTLLDTDRFIANPEVALSPQLILLHFFDVSTFVLANTLFLYTLGFIGLMLLANKYRLSVFAFAVMFVLFNFNGYITAKIGIGFYMWAGYFFLPFFCLFILSLVEKPRPILAPIGLAFTLFFILSQGSFHMYVWCLTFLLLLLLFNWSLLRPVALALIFTGLLSTFRLLPAAITFSGYEGTFISGYPSLSYLLDSLVIIRDHTHTTVTAFSEAAQREEYDIYIGIIGFGVLAFFGIYLRFANDSGLERYQYKVLDLPMFFMSIFSLQMFYFVVAALSIPLLSAERFTARMLIIPVVMLIVIATLRMQPILDKISRHASLRIVAIVGFIIMAMSFAEHSRLWRIFEIEKNAPPLREIGTAVFEIDDPVYLGVVSVSFAITIGTAIILLGHVWWSSRRSRTEAIPMPE